MDFHAFRSFVGRRLCFSFEELRASLGMKTASLQVQLSRWCDSGRVIRLRKGLYTLGREFCMWPLNGPLVANLMVKESYLTALWALEFHGLMSEHGDEEEGHWRGEPDGFYTCATVNSRTYDYENPFGQFRYYKLKPSLMFGAQPTLVEGKRVWVATPEKAVLDYLFVTPRDWGVRRLLERGFQCIYTLDLEMLRFMAVRYRSPRLAEIVGRLRMQARRERLFAARWLTPPAAQPGADRPRAEAAGAGPAGVSGVSADTGAGAGAAVSASAGAVTAPALPALEPPRVEPPSEALRVEPPRVEPPAEAEAEFDPRYEIARVLNAEIAGLWEPEDEDDDGVVLPAAKTTVPRFAVEQLSGEEFWVGGEAQRLLGRPIANTVEGNWGRRSGKRHFSWPMITDEPFIREYDMPAWFTQRQRFHREMKRFEIDYCKIHDLVPRWYRLKRWSRETKRRHRRDPHWVPPNQDFREYGLEYRFFPPDLPEPVQREPDLAERAGRAGSAGRAGADSAEAGAPGGGGVGRELPDWATDWRDPETDPAR